MQGLKKRAEKKERRRKQAIIESIITTKPTKNLITERAILAKAIILIRQLLYLANNKKEKIAIAIAKGLKIVNATGKKI